MNKKMVKGCVGLFSSVVLSVALSACASKPESTTTEIAKPQAEEVSVQKEAVSPPKATQVKPTSKEDGQDSNAVVANNNDADDSWSDDSSSGKALSDPDDPWEGFNRAMFSFNDTLDTYLLRPVAKGYKDYVPQFAQDGVSNFFSNLGEISNLTNNALQGKKNGFVVSTWRFLINSTVGVFGLFDVASSLGLHKFDEDFGQTLGYWGVSSGPYLVLPFFGPSTVRDASGIGVDYLNYDPFDAFDPNQDQRIGRWVLYAIEKRASLLSAESLVIGDRYSFIRDVYLQQRQNEVYDGHPPQKPVQKAVNQDQDSWGDDTDSTDSWGDSADNSSTDSWGDSTDDSSTDSWGDPTSKTDSSVESKSVLPASNAQ